MICSSLKRLPFIVRLLFQATDSTSFRPSFRGAGHKAWVGFSQENGFNQPETGTGCTSSDGSQLSLIVTTAFPQTGNLETDVILLALPSQSGSYSSTVTEEGSVSWSGLNPGCAGNCAQGSTCSHGAIP